MSVSCVVSRVSHVPSGDATEPTEERIPHAEVMEGEGEMAVQEAVVDAVEVASMSTDDAAVSLAVRAVCVSLLLVLSPTIGSCFGFGFWNTVGGCIGFLRSAAR